MLSVGISIYNIYGLSFFQVRNTAGSVKLKETIKLAGDVLTIPVTL